MVETPMKEVFIKAPMKSLQWKCFHLRALVFLTQHSPKFFKVKSVTIIATYYEGRRAWQLTA